MLTLARNKRLALTGLVLFALRRSMAIVFAEMSAHFLGFSTNLLALPGGILALSRLMTSLPTLMKAASEGLPTDLAASRLLHEALLVLDGLLAADAAFLAQEWTLWARLIIPVAIVWHTRMSAHGRSIAIELTRRRGCSTRQWWLENSSATVTAQLVENGFPTAPAGTSVAKFRTSVIAAFKIATTGSKTDMFGLNTHLSHLSGAEMLCETFSLSSSAFSCAALLAAFMTSAIHRRTALASALGHVLPLFVAANTGGSATASTSHINLQVAGPTRTSMAVALTCMTARKGFRALLATYWYDIGAFRPLRSQLI